MQQTQEDAVPIIDMAPFLETNCNEVISAKRKVVLQELRNACEEWGFFTVINHGLNLQFLEKALKVSEDFFGLPVEEKLKVKPAPGSTPYPAGFNNENRTQGIHDRKELLYFFLDDSSTDVSQQRYSMYNVWPENPPHFRSVINEFTRHAEGTSKMLLRALSESLGLPSNLIYDLSQENINMFLMNYYPPSGLEGHTQGLGHHKDGGILTMVAQNNVAGYQLLKGDKWITIEPLEGALVCNIGDTLQVWTNGRYKSVMHRVCNHKDHKRFSLAFMPTPSASAQIAPLSNFTSDIGNFPKYRTFEYMEYLKLRFKNKLLAPNAKDIGIDDFRICA
ncbi:hypothetical protein O6H91_01G125900 [Diphasiastrum complanatum]|uniref:Uncharacterized protein n=1 Tax=Diphasiastrum complanatum TaxID=34168 RepID=A0ACC2EVU7_DIPCM|nr:hypothetical protein O6H91_01G125900 [Diphasiastrum complanatum]